MRKVKKYFYNTDTHKFEKFVVSWRTKLLRALGFLSGSAVTALIIVAIAFRFVASPSEQRMKGDVNSLRDEYGQLQGQIDDLNQAMSELEHRDNGIYRSVFEASPLPDSVRYGKQYSNLDPSVFAYIKPELMLKQIKDGIAALHHRIEVERHSYDTLESLVRSKKKMLMCIPAIQPISNKNLDRLTSGFGYRIDPIYKTPKFHPGLDFAAPIGTPIYSTGDGTVETAGYDAGGYGNHVVINHGYGYETLYGHMVKIKVHVGEHVKRGEVIGWVGSTGKSTGPHCHYEVIRDGKKINPIHYFFNDLTASEYERMVHISSAGNQSLD